MRLINYEFNIIPGPEGNVEVRHESDPVFILAPAHRDFVSGYVQMLKDKKPMAHERLYLRFLDSKSNRPFHEFLIVRRHIRCNFGIFDNKLDIDEKGNLNTEYVPCPHCSECKDYGIVCNSNESVLSSSELKVLNLLVLSHSTKEISEILFLSEHTVHNHRNNMMKKINVNNVAGLIRYFYENIK